MPIEETLCPDCGKKMISRKSQYGTFWGCSDYPNCKGTRDSNGLSKAERNAEREKRIAESDATDEDMQSNSPTILQNDKFRFRKE